MTTGGFVVNSGTTRSAEAVREWLTGQIAGYVQRPAAEIRSDLPLAEYGLDSVSAMTVCLDIEEHLGLSVEPTLVWDHPTVDALSDALAGMLAADS